MPASPPAVFGPALPNGPLPSKDARLNSASTTPRSDTPLHLAVRNADETLVSSLLEQHADIEALDVHGSTALFIAAESGLVGIARVLAERGASVNAECRERPDLRPWTVLQIAAMNGHTDIVRLLLEHGADVNGHGEGVPPPLSEAVFEGHVDAAHILLERGADHILRPDDQLTALHVAASSPDRSSALRIMMLLVEHGADVNAVDMSGTSALDLAVKGASAQPGLDIVQFLLEQGANFSAPSVLHNAAWQGNSGVIRLLHARGANVAASDSRGWTALHSAMLATRIEPDEVEVVRLLLECSVDPNVRAKDPEGLTAVHLAAWNGNTECLRVLLVNGASVNGIAQEKGTPLHCAVVSDIARPAIVQLLLDNGADENALDDDGLTVKQLARMKGAKEILLQLGMEPSGLVMIPSPRAPEDERDDWYNTANPYFLEAERLRRRFFDARSLDDISSALSAYERANSYDPKGFYCLPLIVDGYIDRYRLAGDVSDFDLAMEHLQTALCISSDDRLSRQYAELLLERYDTITNSPFDLVRAMEAFRACLFHPAIGAVGPRLQAARAYVDLCWMYRDAAASMRPFQLAIDMILNDIAGPYGEVDSRYESLAEVRSTLSAAVGAALAAGELTRALEWFERGRCVIWNHALRLRAPVAELRSIAPELADDNERIVAELIKAEDVMAQPMMHPRRMQNAMQHDILAQDLDKLLEKARKLPGLQRFLSPKTSHELRAITVLGPVVVLNAGEHHCDALIFQHGHEEILHITLPSQVHDGLGHILTRFQRCLRGAGLRTRGSLASTLAGSSKPMGQILLALWKLVVEPIFLALNLMDSTTNSSRPLPRITWCVSGPFAFLPLHAAGIYDAPRSRSHKAYEYAVHSYTPSLSALAEALVHRDIPGQARDRPSLFALSQPATPMQAPLPGTVAEITAIKSVIGEEHITWLNGAEATTATVLMHIDKHPWVHLACHAVQDAKKPTQSAFMLQDGGLTLRMLMRRAAISGRKALAVLSACQTATGDETVPEEAVHLAAGMLMTGFQSVIATMWSIGDKDAPIVMSAFYKYLLDEAGGDSAQSAHALHYAVKQLRDEVGEKNFMQWVPFIHMGI